MNLKPAFGLGFLACVLACLLAVSCAGSSGTETSDAGCAPVPQPVCLADEARPCDCGGVDGGGWQACAADGTWSECRCRSGGSACANNCSANYSACSSACDAQCRCTDVTQDAGACLEQEGQCQQLCAKSCEQRYEACTPWCG